MVLVCDVVLVGDVTFACDVGTVGDVATVCVGVALVSPVASVTIGIVGTVVDDVIENGDSSHIRQQLVL